MGSQTTMFNEELKKCSLGDNVVLMVNQGQAMVTMVAGLCDLSKTVVTYSNAAVCVFGGTHEKR